jgi:hypothetical protein
VRPVKFEDGSGDHVKKIIVAAFETDINLLPRPLNPFVKDQYAQQIPAKQPNQTIWPRENEEKH